MHKFYVCKENKEGGQRDDREPGQGVTQRTRPWNVKKSYLIGEINLLLFLFLFFFLVADEARASGTSALPLSYTQACEYFELLCVVKMYVIYILNQSVCLNWTLQDNLKNTFD
jgi:hypothetical protein